MSNQIEPEQVAICFLFPLQMILQSFPSKGNASIEGWSYVPVMCMKEITVRSALEKCIRVMMHINTSKSQQEINHVYLEDAVTLHPDLVVKKQ